MQVRVMNLNTFPYCEHFRERNIEIPAMGEILMDEDEAEYFLAAYVTPKKDSQGRPDPKFFKKLKINVEDLKAIRDKASNALVCHANGQKALTQNDLAQILSSFSHMQAPVDHDAEAEADIIKKQNNALKKENKELKSRLDLIEEKLGLKDVHAEGL